MAHDPKGPVGGERGYKREICPAAQPVMANDTGGKPPAGRRRAAVSGPLERLVGQLIPPFEEREHVYSGQNEPHENVNSVEREPIVNPATFGLKNDNPKQPY